MTKIFMAVAISVICVSYSLSGLFNNFYLANLELAHFCSAILTVACFLQLVQAFNDLPAFRRKQLFVLCSEAIIALFIQVGIVSAQLSKPQPLYDLLTVVVLWSSFLSLMLVFIACRSYDVKDTWVSR